MATMSEHRDPRDPVLGRARYLALRRALATLALGAALAAGLFAGLTRVDTAWLAPTAAEGLVFAGALLGLALVMLGLNHWYNGRPTRGAVPPPGAAPGRAGLGGVAVVGLCAAATAALVWSEHRHRDALALSRDRAGTLDRALFGQVQAPFSGVAGTVTIVAATFLAAGALRRGRA
jgi:hypothetical protein